MKKVWFGVWLALASVGGVRAQSNTLLVYGNINYDSQKKGGITTSSYIVAPALGYQWNDHWTAGVNLSISGTKVADRTMTTTTSLGPFVRYAQPLAGIFAIYGQLNANFSTEGFQGTIFPAIGVNLKNSFALNFNFGSLSFTTGDASAVHLGFGSGAGFGISKNFGLKN